MSTELDRAATDQPSAAARTRLGLDYSMAHGFSRAFMHPGGAPGPGETQ